MKSLEMQSINRHASPPRLIKVNIYYGILLKIMEFNARQGGANKCSGIILENLCV